MPSISPFVFASCLLIGSAALAQGQEPSGPATEWIGGAPFSEWTHATGNWGGYRDHLEDLGIEVAGGDCAGCSMRTAKFVRRGRRQKPS